MIKAQILTGNHFWIALIGIGLFVGWGCNQQQSADGQAGTPSQNSDAKPASAAQQQIATQIQQFVTSGGSVPSTQHRFADTLAADVRQFYTARQFAPAWFVNGKPTPNVEDYRQALAQASQQGLSPDGYFRPQIDSLITAMGSTPSESAQAQADILLSTSFAQYYSDMLNGSIKPSGLWDIYTRRQPIAQQLERALIQQKPSLVLQQAAPNHIGYRALQSYLQRYTAAQKSDWQKVSALGKNAKPEAVTAWATDLAALGYLDSSSATATEWDDKLTTALTQFQENHGLTATGKPDAASATALNTPLSDRIARIRLNMERFRWLPDSLGNRYVWVNIPEFTARVVDKGDTVVEMRCVVGEPKNATPVLVNKPMKNAIFSPTWTIPTSIAREEMEYILKNPAVLVVADVDVFLDGKKVNPMDVNWKDINLKRVRMVQRPKKTNSMGKAKFQFENNYGVYLHDTPNKVDFGLNNRSASHGCVRVQQPDKMAVAVLQGSNWDEGRITAAMNSGKETYATLPEPVKVNFVYFTNWVDAKGNLKQGTDCYGYDKRQMKAMGIIP